MGVNWGKRLGVSMPKDRSVFGLDHRREFRWRKKKVTWPWQVGPTRQRGREKKCVLVRDPRVGRGLTSFLGRKRCPEAFFYFSSFLPFLFLFSYFFHNYFILAPI
jgi:hypothetical protein